MAEVVLPEIGARRRRTDQFMRGVLLAATLVAIVPLVLVIYYLLKQGLSSINGNFFTEDPTGSFFGSVGGARSAILGSLVIVALATVIAVPIGIAVALYLTEYGQESWFAGVIRYFVDVMTGVPSIVFGLFIFITLIITHTGGNFTGWKGSVALALLMLPIVIRSAEVVLLLVPLSLREAALALGAPRWRMILRVVLPTAASGLVTGSLLAVARAMGETAPLLFTIGGATALTFNLSQQMNSMPLQIYNDILSPRSAVVAQAWALGLTLVAMVLILSLIARAVSRRSRSMSTRNTASTRENEQGARNMTGAADQPPPAQIAAETAESKASIERRRGHGVKVKDLNAFYGRQHSIKNVSIDFPANQVTAIIGPSGSGKSTVVRCINRMHEEIPGARAEGSVTLDELDVYGSGVDLTAVRRVIGMVFQKPNPFPTMSIFDNVAAGLRLTGTKSDNLRERVHKSLRAVGLWGEVKNRLNEPGIGLSGGQQQRLCIARTVAVEPEVILMDEPCSALDPIATLKVEELIDELKSRYTIIIVTHNMQQAARVADSTVFMLDGEVVEHAPTNDVFTRPKDERTERYVTGKFG